MLDRWILLAVFSGMAISSAAGDPPPKVAAAPVATFDEVARAWQARQARTETVDCQVDVVMHYFKGSKFVPGEEFLQPTHGRTCKYTVRMQLDGPAKFCFHHRGPQWHRLIAEVLPVEWFRFSDGNQYVNLQRGYSSIPDWKPKPQIDVRPRLDSQQSGWDDHVLTPLLMHYRAFNERHCPFTNSSQWEIIKGDSVEGSERLSMKLLSANHEFSINQYQYSVDPQRDMAVTRIQRTANGKIQWQYDVVYRDGKWGPQPASFQIKRFRNERLAEFAKATIGNLTLNEPIDPKTFQLKTYSD